MFGKDRIEEYQKEVTQDEFGDHDGDYECVECSLRKNIEDGYRVREQSWCHYCGELMWFADRNH